MGKRMKPFRCGVLLGFLVTTGCATTGPDGFYLSMLEKRTGERQWADAYYYIEQLIPSPRPETHATIQRTLHDNPEILHAAIDSFSLPRLASVTKDYDPAKGQLLFEQKRVQLFCMVANQAQCNVAQANVEEVATKVELTLYVSHSVYEGLSSQERSRLNDRYVIRVLPSGEVGVVMERQVDALTNPGSVAGAQLGEVVGSAAYVDRTLVASSPQDYSAKGHLAAGAVGALLGGVIANRPPSTLYRFRYALRTRDDSVRYVDESSSDFRGHAVGACLKLPTLSPLPQSTCEMDLATFRSTYLSARIE